MTPIMQTKLGKQGNCFSACLASLFEIPLADVPNFYDVAGNDDDAWWTAVRNWLCARGFGVMSLSVGNIDDLKLFGGFIIVSGKTIRGTYHAVIYRDGVMAHDPHPSGIGNEPEHVDMIYPLDPARLGLR